LRGRRETRADLVCLGKWVRRAGLGPEVRSLAAVWCGEAAKARIKCSPTGRQHHLTERQLGLRRVGIKVSGVRSRARAATHAVRQSQAQAAGRRIRISRACPNGGWSQHFRRRDEGLPNSIPGLLCRPALRHAAQSTPQNCLAPCHLVYCSLALTPSPVVLYSPLTPSPARPRPA
jgi:hypothetical protein